MKVDQKKLQALQARLLDEVRGVHAALKERGAKYFQRPLAIGGLLIFAAYFYIFQTANAVGERVSSELAAGRASMQYAEDYTRVTGQINRVKRMLPRTKSPEAWLTQSVRRTLREEGIDALETSAPKESVKGGYRVLSVTVKLQSNYHQIASWISRLERSKKLLFIKDMRLRKEGQQIGLNTIQVDVTTVMPAPGGGG